MTLLINKRMWFVLACLLGGALVSWFGQPLAHDNSDAVLVVITVMTVFAGFLVAIIAVLGDPALLPTGSWRAAENEHDKSVAAILTHAWLFRVYLVAIALLFAGVLINKAPDREICSEIKKWVERAYLFMGAFSFLLTLSLPGALTEFQQKRVTAEIERRRADVGIKNS
jgi:hypothetical protein